MAPSEATKLFQKLKLNSIAKSKPPPSPASSDAADRDGADQDGPSAASVSGAIPIGTQQTDYGYAEENGNHAAQYTWGTDTSAINDHAEPEAANGANGEASLETTFRKRQTSISFSDKVTLDTGNEVSIDEPLPKQEARLRVRGRSILHEMAEREQARSKRTHSESERDRYDPLTGKPLDRRKEERLQYHQGEGRHPLLQTTVDDLARNHDAEISERLASLTSETTISPVLEEVYTPRSPMDRDYLTSPMAHSATSSPIGFTSSHLPFGRRSSSQKSRSFRSELSNHGSMRRSRRTSTKSLNSSQKSPAGQFLSMLTTRDEVETPAPQPDEEGQEIDQSGYIIGAQVGMGGFSVVKEAFALENGKRVRKAVKIVRKQVEGKDDEENERLQTEFEREVSIWRFLKHRYILPLVAVYESPFATFCITRFNVGGTLFDLVHSRRTQRLGSLKPALAKRYVYQLASAIQYLHEEVRVVHRDLKLENVLVDMSAPDAEENGGNLLLCDFGMADYIFNENRGSPEPFSDGTQGANRSKSPSSIVTNRTTSSIQGNIGPSQTSTSVTGSLRYAAPELFNPEGSQIYSTAADIWAFGNIIYALLTNRLAFDDPFEPRVVMSIMAADWSIKPLEESRVVQEDGDAPVKLIKGCLDRVPANRPVISEILASPWLNGCAELFDQQVCEWVTE